MHVDDFIDNYNWKRKQEPGVIYARWFFALYRFPEALKQDFKEFMKPLKLYCCYKEKVYRVTGCSRMGDIWLSADMNKEIGYDLRVDVAECSLWRKEL